MNKSKKIGLAAASALSLPAAACGSASDDAAAPAAYERSFFYAGGAYVEDDKGVRMEGQAYVEVLTPAEVRQPYPLVFIHGSMQTSTNWMTTPDGRMGWADYFVREGYAVYLVEQPMRGRSPNGPDDGPVDVVAPKDVEMLFTDGPGAGAKVWPQAARHTQWPGEGPGKGKRGDPVFDAFYASQSPTVMDGVLTQERNRDAGVALLDRIGPAVLVTHSQSGAFGWLIADARPELVRAIVTLEPSGPPFEHIFAALGLSPNPPKAHEWGVTDIPITYEPAAQSPEDLLVEREETPAGEGRSQCLQQASPPRKLINLVDVPVLMLTGEASYHALYDHCTANFLIQAGVPVTHVRLEDHGILGNGHMLMVEKNNLEIAALANDWIIETVGDE